MGVRQFEPKKRVVTAVLWNGRADCLIGMPRFDEIVVGIISIDKKGYAELSLEGRGYLVQPNQHYIVVTLSDRLEVWTTAFMKEHYKERAVTIERHSVDILEDR